MDSDQQPVIKLRMQKVEELAPGALFAVEKLSAHFKQEAMAAHDAYGRIYFMWTFEQDEDPVQVHMLQTVQLSWALGVADFGHDGELARKWRKANKNTFKTAKKTLLKTEGIDVVYEKHDSFAGE
jgi:hypothetical protein